MESGMRPRLPAARSTAAARSAAAAMLTPEVLMLVSLLLAAVLGQGCASAGGVSAPPAPSVRGVRTAPASPPLDLVLSGGSVIDGTGGPSVRADVGVAGDRIVAVGDLSGAQAARHIDIEGLAVAPGFIDMLGQSELNLLVDNRVESKIRQGITTEISGEGISVAPMNAQLVAEIQPMLDKFQLKVDWTDLPGYARRFAQSRSALNLGMFAGAAQIRSAVLGLGDVQPTPAQLAEMVAEVERQMDAGALGVSTGLIYQPGSYAKTPELIALAAAAARKGGIYATHLRSESAHLLDAIDEALRIGREAKIAVEIWHFKAAGRRNWPREKDAIARIERAQAEGIDVAANVYPYVASANGLDANLPDWAHAGGADAMVARIRDPVSRARLLREVHEDLARGSGTSGMLLLSAVDPSLQRYLGRTLSSVAREMGKSPEEALLDLVAADRGATTVARFGMSEANVRLALKKPWVSLCTDYGGQALDGPYAKERAHPRAFGTMPRVLGLYARELKLFSIEEAVRKMTSLPAGRVGLLDRGLVRPGMMADLTVFDPKTVRDTATFQDPGRYPIGIRWVIVNGQVTLDDGVLTSARAGRLVRPSRAATDR
jgi:N-acyl-D-amino-acid deacylase